MQYYALPVGAMRLRYSGGREICKGTDQVLKDTSNSSAFVFLFFYDFATISHNIHNLTFSADPSQKMQD